MKKWPNVYPQGAGFVVDCGLVDGKRDRKYFKNKTLANTAAARRREERARGRVGALSISDSDLMDAVAALRVLAGTGITLESLARKAVSVGAAVSMTVGELFDLYEDEKQGSGVRSATLVNIRNRAGRFAAACSGVPLGEITAQHISGWLSDQGFSPVTRNTFLNGIRTMFVYAQKNEWLERNPAAFVDMTRTTQELPAVYSVAVAQSLLGWLVGNSPEMVPYFALGFFAGIRPAETMRIRPVDVSWSEKIITVSPEATKTHMRHVDIRPNLLAWLKEYPMAETGAYYSRRKFRKMLQALEVDWRQDVLRKSFISYHLAAFRDQNETAHQAGHRNTDMLYTNYRNIHTVDDVRITQPYAKAYWKITPAQIQSLSLSLKK